ncbi:hypothetical protein ANCDUO_11680 [Ancylostoma duodenale]|uniref:Peptidase A2 domain-containing protein n=1 Tax=Ancylostoma duodenale TaxID=51022 RepID=A0A0C2GAV2_9BILA|nr:hypothetical protein ANCDUO_11680 [Ancylostoma duodenale]
MSCQFATPKRLLMHYCKKLETALMRFKTDKLETLSIASIDEELSPTFIRDNSQRLEEALGVIEAATSKIQQLLQDYAVDLAALVTPVPKEEEDFEKYSSKAEEILTSAFDYNLLLQARIRAFKSLTQRLFAPQGITRAPGTSIQSEPPLANPTLLEEIISNEEMVTLYIGGSDRSSLPTSTRFDNKSRQVSISVPSCMYCEGKHKSFACDKYRAPQEQSQYLRDHKLCLICASPQHITSECQRRPCFKCQKRHHTSCCFQSGSKEWNPTPKKEFDHKKKVKGTSNGGKEPKLLKSSVKVNQLGHDEQDTASPEEETILEVRSKKRPQRRQGTFLPTGELTVMNPTTKELRKVDVLLDTGAEISFFDTTLAQ